MLPPVLFFFILYDYVYNVYGSTSKVLDVKAHCDYVNKALEEGGLALVLMLIFFGYYIINTGKVLRRIPFPFKKVYGVNGKTKLQVDSMAVMSLALLFGCVWYLCDMLANDGYIGVEAIFWCMLGTGLAVNRILTVRYGIVLKEEKKDGKH